MQMNELPITFKEVQAVRVLSTRRVTSSPPRLYNAALDALHRHDLPYTRGPWIALVHGDGASTVDLEVGVIVPADFAGSVPLADGGALTPRDLPPVRQMACLVHRGSYNSLGWSYRALHRWMAKHGYRAAGPSREVYLNTAADVEDESELLTEIQCPLDSLAERSQEPPAQRRRAA